MSTNSKPNPHHHSRHVLPPKHILVLAAGSFATACAILFARGNKDNKVVIYDYKQTRVDSINNTHTNPDYLHDFTLPPNITATTDPKEAFVNDVEFIFHAIPVQSSVEYLTKIKPYIDQIVKSKEDDYNKRVLVMDQWNKIDQNHQCNDNCKEQFNIHDDIKTPTTPSPSTPDLLNHMTPSQQKPNLYDVEFVKPLVIISMSKGLHQQRLQCMHEVINDILGLHELDIKPHQFDQITLHNTLHDLSLFYPDHSTTTTSSTTISTSRRPSQTLQPANKPTTFSSPFLPRSGSQQHLSQQPPPISPSSPPIVTIGTNQSVQSPIDDPFSNNKNDDENNTNNNNNNIIPKPQFLVTGYLSGPSFAKEIAAGQPTGFTIASTDINVATLIAQTISQDKTTMCTTSTDIWGVEVAGALKNVYSIGAGIIEQAGFQYNTKALYITRSCAEMSRIGSLLYHDRVDRATFSTLAGIGDLLLTCLGPSRNKNVGILLAQGLTLEEIKIKSDELAEGVPTTAAVYSMLDSKGLLKYCPILQCVYRLLYENMSITDAINFLLTLPVVSESF